jgi:hypothetical protein
MSLFERLRLFGTELTDGEKDTVCYASVFNDLRLVEADAEVRHERVRNLSRQWLERPTPFVAGHPWPRDYAESAMQVPTLHDWSTTLVHLAGRLCQRPGSSPFDRALRLNRHLAAHGLCPLLHYAFDDWHCPEADPHASVDLSTTFLYRLVGEVPVPDANLIGSGAYAHVLRRGGKAGHSVDKIPRNLAARRFAMHQEFMLSRYLASTALAPYLTPLLAYDDATGSLERTLVDGPSGTALLCNWRFADDIIGRDQLKEIWSFANCLLAEHRINLDIHPGNFRWCSKQGRWFLVDLGPMPRIGADYYPRDSFDAYLEKCWIDLHALMSAVPIRSTDLDVRAAVPAGFYQTFVML